MTPSTKQPNASAERGEYRGCELIRKMTKAIGSREVKEVGAASSNCRKS